MCAGNALQGLGEGVGVPSGRLSLGGSNDGDGVTKISVGSGLGDTLGVADCVGSTTGPTEAVADLVGFNLIGVGFTEGCTATMGGFALWVTTGVAAGAGTGKKTIYTAGHNPFKLIIAARTKRPAHCCHNL